MGKFKIFSILLVAMFVLIACGDSKESTKEQGQDSKGDTVGVNTEPKEESKKELTHNYPYFELKVEYPENNQYVEVFYDFEGDVSKTKYDITATNTKENKVSLSGQEAYDKLEDALKELTFDTSKNDNSVMFNIVEKWRIYTTFTKFQLKVKFKDGTEKEYLIDRK